MWGPILCLWVTGLRVRAAISSHHTAVQPVAHLLVCRSVNRSCKWPASAMRARPCICPRPVSPGCQLLAASSPTLWRCTLQLAPVKLAGMICGLSSSTGLNHAFQEACWLCTTTPAALPTADHFRSCPQPLPLQADPTGRPQPVHTSSVG